MMTKEDLLVHQGADYELGNVQMLFTLQMLLKECEGCLLDMSDQYRDQYRHHENNNNLNKPLPHKLLPLNKKLQQHNINLNKLLQLLLRWKRLNNNAHTR